MNGKKDVISIVKAGNEIKVDIAGLGEALCDRLKIRTIGGESKVLLFPEGPCRDECYRLVLDVPTDKVELDNEGLWVRVTHKNESGAEYKTMDVRMV